MNWDKSQVYVMRLAGSDAIGMWWYEETPESLGMWRTLRVGPGLLGGVWRGRQDTSYGPGSFLKSAWQPLDNPTPLKRDRLVDCEWIAKV